ncbi:hypothetical protein Tco_1077706, partial [Tanacetum coccineum]
CQLDEQWFNLHKYILRDALDITPSNDNNPFVAPPSSDTVIEYVNTLGYPSTLTNAKTPCASDSLGVSLIAPTSTMLKGFGKSLFNPYKLSSLTGRTLLQILVERRRPLICLFQTSGSPEKQAQHTPRLVGSFRQLKEENTLNTLMYVGKDGREIFGMPIPDALLNDTIKSEPYYSSYLEHVTEYQHYLNEEHNKAYDKSLEPASSKPPKPTPTPTESSKKDQGKKRKLVMESTDAPSPAKRSKAGKTPKPKNPADQFIFQRRTPMPTEPSEHADSPSLDAELALTDSETESEEEVLVIKVGDQDKARLGPTMVNKIKLGYE